MIEKSSVLEAQILVSFTNLYCSNNISIGKLCISIFFLSMLKILHFSRRKSNVVIVNFNKAVNLFIVTGIPICFNFKSAVYAIHHGRKRVQSKTKFLKYSSPYEDLNCTNGLVLNIDIK